MLVETILGSKVAPTVCEMVKWNTIQFTEVGGAGRFFVVVVVDEALGTVLFVDLVYITYILFILHI